MGSKARVARGATIVAFVAALVTSFGCGGGSGGGGGATQPTLLCSDSGTASANTVTLKCGGAIGSATERIDVVLGGPAAGTTTVRGLNFDVTYDPGQLEFVAAGATSPLFPDAFVIVALANGEQGRVVVGIQQPGGLGAVTVTTGERDVLALSFRRLAGATFGPTPLMFDRADATSASTAIGFTSGLTLEYQ